MKFTSHSVAETQDFAKQYVGGIVKRIADEARSAHAARDGAFIVCLYGNLGSGKTAFTQAVAAALGIEEQVTSPTYVIEKIYQISHNLSTEQSTGSTQGNAHTSTHSSPQFLEGYSTVFTHLIHIDAYRLESADEMKHLGWDEIAANPRNIIIVEWPEKIAPLLPANNARLNFTFIDETTREIEVVQ